VSSVPGTASSRTGVVEETSHRAEYELLVISSVVKEKLSLSLTNYALRHEGAGAADE
jgi:hypothetical protein